jgi:hypothetical protein
MKKATRYVKYSFTCASNHVNQREELLDADTDQEASEAIKRKQLICDYCFLEPSEGSQVLFTVNDAIVPADNGEGK